MLRGDLRQPRLTQKNAYKMLKRIFLGVILSKGALVPSHLNCAL